MNTFATEYMSTTPVGISSNVVKSLPRSIEIPISKKFISNDKMEKIKQLKTSILTLADLISKMS